MTDHELRLMMLDVDGVLSRHGATPTNVLTAAQALATSAIGDLTNKGNQPDKLHTLADAIAQQIREALHRRIDEGPKPDWKRNGSLPPANLLILSTKRNLALIIVDFS